MFGILFSLRIFLRCEESEVHELHFDLILGILVTLVHTGDVGPDGACEPNITGDSTAGRGSTRRWITQGTHSCPLLDSLDSD